MVQTIRERSRQRAPRRTRERGFAPCPGAPPRASSPRYDRRTELPRVLPLWPHELADESPQGHWKIVGKLRRALRAERRRGIAGHWTFDLARHAELLRLYRLELASSGVRDMRRR